MFKAVGLFLVLLFTFATFVVVEADAPVSEDGVKFEQTSYAPGETVTFFIRDSDLGLIDSCTATWSHIASKVTGAEWWNIVTGAPNEEQYDLAVPCSYDTTSPSSTPLSFQFPWTVSVDGTATLVSNLDSSTGRFMLITEVDSNSTVSAVFNFDVVNSYSSTSTRAKIISSSDTNGEWVGFSEITSETNTSPDSISTLFFGNIVLSDNVSSQNTGDGLIWVQSGDSITVTYFEADGVTPIASDTTDVEIFLTPTPIPASGPMALAGLAGAFIVLLSWRLRRASATAQGDP